MSFEQDKKHILSLPDNFDDEGSPSYKEATVDAAWFYATMFCMLTDIEIEKVDFEPSSDGSIDVHYKEETEEFLINVPADANSSATFYAEMCHLKIKGTLKEKEVE